MRRQYTFWAGHSLESGRDVLTRLLNRKFMPVVLTKQIDQAINQKTIFSVAELNIDHFRQVNDTYGHQAGDSVLQQLALILVNRLVEKLRESVERELFGLPEGKVLKVTISAGVACFSGHPDYQRLIRKADDALYEAKSLSRNRVIVA